MTEAEIRRELGKYLLDERNLKEFNEWFVANTWDDLLDDGPVGTLVREIELSLAEYSSGHLDQDELKKRFGQLANRYFRIVQFGTDQAGITTSAANSTTHLSPIGAVHVVEFAS